MPSTSCEVGNVSVLQKMLADNGNTYLSLLRVDGVRRLVKTGNGVSIWPLA